MQESTVLEKTKHGKFSCTKICNFKLYMRDSFLRNFAYEYSTILVGIYYTQKTAKTQLFGPRKYNLLKYRRFYKVISPFFS